MYVHYSNHLQFVYFESSWEIEFKYKPILVKKKTLEVLFFIIFISHEFFDNSCQAQDF